MLGRSGWNQCIGHLGDDLCLHLVVCVLYGLLTCVGCCVLTFYCLKGYCIYVCASYRLSFGLHAWTMGFENVYTRMHFSYVKPGMTNVDIVLRYSDFALSRGGRVLCYLSLLHLISKWVYRKGLSILLC